MDLLNGPFTTREEAEAWLATLPPNIALQMANIARSIFEVLNMKRQNELDKEEEAKKATLPDDSQTDEDVATIK